jgi:hypothetical protein
MGRVEKARQGPAGIVVNVGGEAQLGALPHNPRQRVDHALRYKAPLVVPPFWPGVRVEHEHPRKERVWGRFDDRLCVATPQAHIRKVLAPEPRERSDKPIEKRLAADNSDIQIGFRLPNNISRGVRANARPSAKPSSTIENCGSASASRRFWPTRSALPRLRP